MKILGIDTSTSFASVGLSVDGNVSSEKWRSRHNHGREVMPSVMRLLESAGIAAEELDTVAVATGPGGFSAVRVGIATGQGLTAPTAARLIGISTHLIQSYQHRGEEGKRIVSLIPVGRNQLSYGVYSSPMASSFEDAVETGLCDVSEVSDRFCDMDTILCGEGASEMTATSGVVRDPECLLAIAADRLAGGYGLDDQPVVPVYSRPPTITASKKGV